MALGHHLSANKYVNRLLFKALKQFHDGTLFCCGIAIHASDSGIREKFLHRRLKFFGAKPQFFYLSRPATVTVGGRRARKPAVMAFKRIGLLMKGKGDVTVFASQGLPAGSTECKIGESAPV